MTSQSLPQKVHIYSYTSLFFTQYQGTVHAIVVLYDLILYHGRVNTSTEYTDNQQT